MPKGHLALAKIAGEMLNKHDESDVIKIIKEPWTFFAKNNRLKRGLTDFPGISSNSTLVNDR